ncbi:hypothetical protein THRCLA_10922, partial [Thraustotheca clavata]
MVSAPKSWGRADFAGGDFLCPPQYIAPYVSIQFSNQGSCITNKEDNHEVDITMASQALLALGPNYDFLEACSRSTMQFETQCVSFLQDANIFLTNTFTLADWVEISQLSHATKLYIQSQGPISVVQYIGNTSGTFLLDTNIFDVDDEGYHLYGWFYLIQWIKGIREVIQFKGERGYINSISARNAIHVAPVNSLEIPLNVAYFCRCILLYVTAVLFFVACIAFYYITTSKGAIEGINMFAINRVTGLVWIGRPLLFLRVWIAAALWCFTSPIEHQASINRSCYVVDVDYEIACKSGSVVIGDKLRFVGLIFLAIGLVFLCYIVQRFRFPHIQERQVSSYLLYATALHHFKQDHWIYQNVYYIDRASAAIN